MASEPDYEIFDDGVLVTIDGDVEPDGPSGLDLLEQALEKRLAEECVCNQDRIPVLRETFARLKSRTNPPDQNVRDYYRIVHYLLYDRVDPDPLESSS